MPQHNACSVIEMVSSGLQDDATISVTESNLSAHFDLYYTKEAIQLWIVGCWKLEPKPFAFIILEYDTSTIS